MLKPDCLRGGRADLLAYDTLGIHCPRQAAPPVVKGSTDFQRVFERLPPHFLFYAEFFNGPGGADLAAENAIELTVTYLVQ